MAQRETTVKQQRLESFLERFELDGVLLQHRANFAWVTNGRDNHVPGNTPEGAAMGAAGPEGAVPPEGGALPEPGVPGEVPSQMLSQYQIVGGEARPRIVGQQEIQKSGG